MGVAPLMNRTSAYARVTPATRPTDPVRSISPTMPDTICASVPPRAKADAGLPRPRSYAERDDGVRRGEREAQADRAERRSDRGNHPEDPDLRPEHLAQGKKLKRRIWIDGS